MRLDADRKASMSPERRERIVQIADELEQQGLPATNSAVYARALGYRGHVVQVMKERRAERAAAGGVAVIEEPEEEDDGPDEPTETLAATIQEDLKELESSYDAWHLALERLWEVERDGPLSEANFARKSWLEYQMTSNIRTQEQLRPQLAQARMREALAAAQAQHDAGIEAARTLAEQALMAVATLHDLWEDLAEAFSAQVDLFYQFRDRHGMQAFDVESGRTYALQLFSAFFPNDPRAKTSL